MTSSEQSNIATEDVFASLINLDSFFLNELAELSQFCASPQYDFSILNESKNRNKSIKSKRNSSSQNLKSSKEVILSSRKKEKRISQENNSNTSKCNHVRRELFSNSNEVDEFENLLSNLNSKPKVRTRSKLNEKQQSVLEETFKLNHYPDAGKIDELAQALDLTFQKVTIWFQNRRARFKKNFA